LLILAVAVVPCAYAGAESIEKTVEVTRLNSYGITTICACQKFALSVPGSSTVTWHS
jgi:hypothetical protein